MSNNVLIDLQAKGLINPSCPPWLANNTHYLTIMGSHAYGVADTSVKEKVPDYDVYGWAIPPKETLFPHSEGKIMCYGEKPGTFIMFGTPKKGFEQFQQNHILDQDALGGAGKEWDFQIFNIVKFFELCRQNNPNMLDSLFTPENCVIHCTQIGQMVRDKRRMFLSKEAWKRFRGYAQEQLKKMNTKDPIGGRREIVEKWGYDIKFAYHIVRLFDEAEQILLEGDIDLQRSREVMKSVRRGEWTAEEIREWARQKDIALEVAYTNCKLPEKPPEAPLNQLLLDCLEQHYGSLKTCVEQTGWAEGTLRSIDAIMQEVRQKMYGG